MRGSGAFDLLVVGGGPAGAATAIAAARLGLRVALLERGGRRAAGRGESLPPSVRPLLERLGMFDVFRESGPLPCYANRSLWGVDGMPAAYDFLNEPYGLGWQIDRTTFDAMFLAAAEHAGAQVLHEVSVGELARDDNGWRISLRGVAPGAVLAATVVADASGRARVVARAQGARFRAVDRLMAAVWRLSAGATEDTLTLVEAVREGWWYSAVSSGGRLTLTFFSDPDLQRTSGVRSPGGARTLLGRAPATLARLRDVGACLSTPPVVVSAVSGRLERAAGDRWLAAGDAAACFDPISSHGVGAALDAGIAAAEAVARSLDGDRAGIDTYDRRMRHGFARYLRRWQDVYRQEDRWSEALFWRRRHAATELPAPG